MAANALAPAPSVPSALPRFGSSFGATPLAGVLLMVASTVFFSSGDVITKVLATSLPAVEIAWIRYVTFLVLLLPWLLRESGGMALRSHRPVLQILRGLGMVGSGLLFTFSLAHLPVADATAVFFVSPLVITALAIPFLGEKVGWRRWTATFVGALGVVIVIRPGTGAFQVAALLPLVGACFWAVSAIATRLMSGVDRTTTTLAYSAMVGLATLSFVVPSVWVTPSWTELGLAVAMGVLSTAGHGLVVLAYRNASASVVAPYAYVQLLWAGVFGFMVFGTVPDRTTILGAAVIAASGLYTAWRERVRSAERQQA